MNITQTTYDCLSEQRASRINELVARGFGQDPTAMLTDTKDHLAAADTIQTAEINQQLVAVAMYRSCLWRPCG